MNQEELNAALANATPDEKRRINAFVEELKRRELRERAQNDFMAFVEYIWPDFINGAHHRRMASLFQDVAASRKKRVIINLAPRHTKSEFTSYLLPAWLLGKYPTKKIMQVSNTAELAEGFGRKVRNLVGSEEYQEIFPGVGLQQDSKAAGRWNTNHGGSYYATGVGGALAGRGADYCLGEFTKIIVDDDGVPREVNLGSIKVGDKVRSKFGVEEVTRVKNTKHKAYIKINTDVLASHEHKFLTMRGWVRAGDLTLRDAICTDTDNPMPVTQLECVNDALDMIDITVEPSHEFYIKCIDDTIITHNCIVDDPHTEAEALAAISNPGIYDKTYDWYTSGPRQRLQPGGSILICMTRWHTRDLTGKIINASQRNDGAENWEVFEFPAILPSGNPLWPEYWSLEELQAVKAEIPNAKWQAQYQQQPTSEESAIIKREWWQMWDRQDPPSNIEYVLMSWDTAFEKHNNADFSAMTVWGVFYKDNADDGTRQTNIILLDAVKKRVEFPELKQWAIDAYREWSPDGVIIEKRASGAPLIYELRRMGIPVQEYTPTKGNDKISRLNSIADIFASGFVWAPDTRWAEEVIDEVASFPAGEHDDLVDTVSQALMRFRQGGFVKTLSDEEYETQPLRRRRPYY